MKNLLLFLLKKVGVKLSGPLGWVASIIIEKLLIHFEKQIRKYIKYLKDSYEINKIKKNGEQNAEKLETILVSETKTESEIDDASSDFLNNR